MNAAVEHRTVQPAEPATWYERELAAVQRAHGKRWPEHREWVEAYLREEMRQREAGGAR